MYTVYMHSLKLLQSMVKDKHLQENTLFDLDPSHIRIRIRGINMTIL